MRPAKISLLAMVVLTVCSSSLYASGGSPLVAGQFIGGIGADNITDLTRTPSGDIVVCGNISSAITIGDAAGANTTGLGGEDGFLAILSSDLRTVKAFTYVGGSGPDSVVACAVRPDGKIVVCGVTESVDVTTTQPCIDPTFSSHRDGFLQIFQSDLSALTYGTYINGNRDDVPLDMAVDQAGAIYICGKTTSTNDLPLTNSLQPQSKGSQDAFILKLSPSGTQVMFGTYLGGAGDDAAVRLALRQDGAVLVTGWTESSDFTVAPNVVPPFPWSPGGERPYDGTFNGGRRDAFLAMYGADGAKLIFSTFFGGNEDDEGRVVGFDAQNNPVLFGITRSRDLPVTAGRQQDVAGGIDGFIASFSTEGKTLLTSSYFGGNGDDIPQACALVIGGQFYVMGSTTSRDWLSEGAGTSTTIGGARDMFLIRVSASQLGYVTLIGGSGIEDGVRMILDDNGDIYATCGSTSPRLPVGIDTTTNAGPVNTSDGLIIKWAFGTVSLLSPTTTTSICQGQNVNFTWTTTEIGAQVHFALEYSTDRRSWTSLADSLTTRALMWMPRELDPGVEYWFRLKSSRGHVHATSKALRVGRETKISILPDHVEVCAGEPINLMVSAEGDFVTYQWKRDGVDIPNATANIYSITASDNSAEGTYAVLVSGRCGSLTSQPVSVRVVATTEIVRQPEEQSLQSGDRLELTMEANVQTADYQWHRNGSPIPHATTPSYVVEAVTTEHDGVYRCVVTASCGVVTSSAVRVRVDTTTTSIPAEVLQTLTLTINDGQLDVGGVSGAVSELLCTDIRGTHLSRADLRSHRGPVFVTIVLEDRSVYRRILISP